MSGIETEQRNRGGKKPTPHPSLVKSIEKLIFACPRYKVESKLWFGGPSQQSELFEPEILRAFAEISVIKS